MAKQESVFARIGMYPGEASAQADYQAVKDLHSARAVGTYDAAVIIKDYNGKVHEVKDEMPTRHGAWVGAAVGIMFRPAIIGSAAVDLEPDHPFLSGMSVDDTVPPRQRPVSAFQAISR